MTDECLRLSEEENTKARRIILWCAERMTLNDRTALINMVKEHIEPDATESDRELELKLFKAIDKLCDVIQEGLDADANPKPQWWAKLDAHAGQVRGLAQEVRNDQSPTLHELREGLLP